MQTAASGLAEVEMSEKHSQGGASSLPTPRGDLYTGAKGCEILVGVLAGANLNSAVDRCAGAVPDSTDVREGACLPRAQRDVLRVLATLVIRVHQQLRQLVDSATDPGDVAGDGRGDPMAVLGHALPIFAKDHPSVTIELAVAARRVPAGEVSEKDQISGSPGEAGESLPGGLAACDCLWLGLCWT
ncbi:hypothetical protein [Streptomyces sp. 2221.1]|uniref:hypothetical protein n=1 Tax=Streptomyces sp. 2221.1 TaxID=1938837 RepID=UPI002162A9E6|nr:hypothetical protein [Streptomyces sp. 2221.1]